MWNRHSVRYPHGEVVFVSGKEGRQAEAAAATRVGPGALGMTMWDAGTATKCGGLDNSTLNALKPRYP